MKTIVCDGNLLLYKIYFTPVSWALSHNDHKTGGVYVFLKTIHKILDQLYGGDRLVVVWDGARSKRRLELYPDYKASRPSGSLPPEVKDDFGRQQVLLERIFRTIGVRSVMLPDKEGDDVIYRITKNLEQNGPVVIVSDDKDMLTMLSEKVDVFRVGKDTYYSAQTFLDEYGFMPELFKYWKAIVGDSSDNIKGVIGAGEKTATDFSKGLHEGLENDRNGKFDVVSELVATVKESKNKRLRAIAEQWETVERNLRLMDCSEEVFTNDQDKFIMQRLEAPMTFDEQRFFEQCDEHGFKSIKQSHWLNLFRKLK